MMRTEELRMFVDAAEHVLTLHAPPLRFVPPLAAQFLDAHPRWRVELAPPAPAPSFAVTRSEALPAVVCASPAYWRRRGLPVDARTLSTHNCLDRGVWRFRRGDEMHAVRVGGNLRIAEPELAVEAALAGAGVINVPAFLAEDALWSGKLVRALDDHVVQPSLVATIAWRAAPGAEPVAATFATWLAERMGMNATPRDEMRGRAPVQRLCMGRSPSQ